MKICTILCLISFEITRSTSLDPIKINTLVNDTPINGLVNVNKDSTYLLFFYSFNCHYCWDAIENVKAFKNNNVVDKVIGFTVGTPKELTIFEKQFNTKYKSRLISPIIFRNIASIVPFIAVVKNNTIVFTDNSPIISPYTYKRRYSNNYLQLRSRNR